MAVRFFELPKYDITVLVQDPSSGLITEQTSGHIDFYKEGGTVRTGNTINDGNSGAILMFDTGAIGVGDFIFKNTDPTQIVEVTAINFGSLSITNNSGAPFTVDVFDRLIASTNRPLLYADERGRGAGFNQLALAAGGIEAYGFAFDGILYDGSGTALKVLKEQTPIGGEDEVDIRKFGALCDGVADDTDAILAAIDYVEAQAALYGPRVLRFHGAPHVSGKLVIAGTGIILRGDGQDATFLWQDAAQNLLEISGPSCTVEDMSLLFDSGAGITNRPLDILNTASDFRGRRLRLITLGTGVAVRSDGATFDDVLLGQGDGWSRAFTIIGQATQNLGTSISRLRGAMSPSGSQLGVVVEQGAMHFRLRDSVLTVTDPATQSMVCVQFQLGGGNVPEDCIVADSYFSSGQGIAHVFNAGAGIQYSRVLTADSRIGHRTATVGGSEAQGVTWAFCGCVGIGEASWVFDDTAVVKQIQSCWSSDVSLDGDGLHPHMSINANNTFVDGFMFGNFVRLTMAIEASHGIKYESAFYTLGHIHGATNIVTSVNAGVKAGGDAIHAPDANIDSSIDISHNSHPRNKGIVTLLDNVDDHMGVSMRSKTEASGTTLKVGAYGLIQFTGTGRTYTAYTVGVGNDGHEILLVNRSGNTMLFNHVGGTWINIGAAVASVLTNQAVRYVRIGTAYVQMGAPFTIG